MYLAGLWLTDFRCYEEAELRFPAGVTVICGANAQGKTSLLEAVGWAATGKSFRGVSDSTLVRVGAEAAILRAEVVDGARVQLLEAEIRASGRNRVQRGSGKKLSPFVKFMCQRCGLREALLALAFGPGFLVGVDEQHVFHRLLLGCETAIAALAQ